MEQGERLVYGGAVVLFSLLFLATLWPVYPLFSGIRPRILGLPLSLAYVILCLLLSFLAQLALFLWEGDRREESDAPGEAAVGETGVDARDPSGAPPDGPPRVDR